MIEPATKTVSRLQIIRERVAAARQTGQQVAPAAKPAAQRSEEKYNRSLAEALLTILAARGFRLTAPQRKRIVTCAEPTQIEAWIAKAATAKSVASVLNK